MGWDKGQLEDALALFLQSNAGFYDSITPILWTNLEEGRIAKLLESGTVASIEAYVQRVKQNHDHWHTYVHKLQVEQDVGVWDDKYVKLQKWAYRSLEKRLDLPKEQLYEHGLTCATDSAEVLLTKRFPYDVHFERWAYVVTQNICLRLVTKFGKQLEKVADLGELDEWLDSLADPAGDTHHANQELRHQLFQAIAKLSLEADRQFLHLYYFEHKTFDEIAETMGVTKNALYQRHRKALIKLRKIWLANDDI